MPVNKTRRKKTDTKPMLFTFDNYKFMGIGVFLVLTGFAIMRIENEVYGLVSLYISPVIILTGYIVVIYAILKKGPEISGSLNKPSN